MNHELVFLYIEDDAMSRMVMDVLLRRELGFKHLTILEDSQNFLDRLSALPARPDVIFLDIHMEPHDGFAMLEMLRSQPLYNDTIVIALTASVMNDEIETLRRAGFNGAIGKPIDAEVFPKLLQRMMNGESIWYIS